MSSALYEIVELANGDIALQRAGEEDAEPLVSIRFSEESLYYLNSARLAIAKAMIEAGLEALGELSEEAESLEDADGVADAYDDDKTIH